MSDLNQVLLIAVVIILTSLLVIIGWQIYQILSEIRKMFIKFNTITDSVVSLSQSFSKSIQNISGFSQGLRTVFGVFKLFRKRTDNEK